MVAVVVIMDGNYAFLKARGQRGPSQNESTVCHNFCACNHGRHRRDHEWYSYAVLKAHGPCSVMRDGKRKNNGYKGTNRH